MAALEGLGFLGIFSFLLATVHTRTISLPYEEMGRWRRDKADILVDSPLPQTASGDDMGFETLKKSTRRLHNRSWVPCLKYDLSSWRRLLLQIVAN